MSYQGDPWTPEDTENLKKGITRQPRPTGTPAPAPAPAPIPPAQAASPAPASPAPASATAGGITISERSPAAKPQGPSADDLRSQQWFTPPASDTSNWAQFQRGVLRPMSIVGSQIPGGIAQDLATAERLGVGAANKVFGTNVQPWEWTQDPDRLGRYMTPTALTPMTPEERIEAATGRGIGESAPLALATGQPWVLMGGATAGALGGASWQAAPDDSAAGIHSAAAGASPEVAAVARGLATMASPAHAIPLLRHAIDFLSIASPQAAAILAAKTGVAWQIGATTGDLRKPPLGQLQSPVAGWPSGSPSVQPNPNPSPIEAPPAPAAASAAARQTPPGPSPEVPMGVGSPDLPPMMAPQPYVRPPGPTIANMLGFPTAQAQPPLNPNLGPVPAGITWTQPTAQNPASTPILPDTRNPLMWAPGGAGL